MNNVVRHRRTDKLYLTCTQRHVNADDRLTKCYFDYVYTINMIRCCQLKNDSVNYFYF